MTELATLPRSSDAATWNPEERALVEAAGLVHMDSQSGQKALADRATVAAFLQHCARTGLDPIARQIYSIARKSRGQLRWQIQISIDGARLVAERTGQYEGQTTPEFTADGVTWTQAWLAEGPPKAARVGVYRAGFREPLYVVALWDAYVQTTFKGEVTEMWKKMGPLMLAKCAEMLALRKAFPQDLSGLYSAEEMSQATKPTEVESRSPAAEPVVEAVAVIEAPSRDYKADADAATSYEDLKPIHAAAQQAGELGFPIAAGSDITVNAYLRSRKEALTVEPETVEAELVPDDIEDPAPRDWAAAIASLTTPADTKALYVEARDSGAPAEVLNEIAAVGERQMAAAQASTEGWPTAEVPSDEWDGNEQR